MNARFPIWINRGAVFAAVIVTLRGVSMLPAIKDGQSFVLEKRPFETLQPGQIAVCQNYFYRPSPWTGDTTTHRLIRLKNGGWVTKGDNNNREDLGLCSAKNYRGIVAEILPMPNVAKSSPYRKDAP